MMLKALRPILLTVAGSRTVRSAMLALLYVVVILFSIIAAYMLRFDFHIPSWLDDRFFKICTVMVCVHMLCMVGFRQFDGLLRHFGVPDLKRLSLACFSAIAAMGVLRLVAGVHFAPPWGVLVMHYFLSMPALSMVRMTFQTLRRIANHDRLPLKSVMRPVGIVGAGDAGAALARDLLAKPWLGMKPIIFFDDNLSQRSSVHGIPVAGPAESIPATRLKLGLQEIIIAMPSAPAKRIREILKICRQAVLACRTVPSLDQMATGHLSVTNLREIEIHDLLGRAPVEINGETVRVEIEGRTVMVTGAGGSIGSELCRQILSFKPAVLVLIERSEPNLFAIEQELRPKAGHTQIIPSVVDITNWSRMRQMFRRYRPGFVFHAAAHKHVPMMEMQPAEAIRNNVFGTATLADLSVEYGVERFIHISTDKAVNPTNVMGATKRLAEMYLQSFATRPSRTKFIAVRFGNVLGSSGSVVPTFRKQIAQGGPVTVTHPDIIRYFMTIPEAVSLVLQSSIFGKGSDIFVLDMGKPVKILELAMQMIALSGLTPHEDIEIHFTGLRPGEKLFEELSHGGESTTSTPHEKISRLVTTPTHHSFITAFLDELKEAIEHEESDPATLKEVLSRMLPEYVPSPENNELTLEQRQMFTLQDSQAASSILEPATDGPRFS